MSQTPMGLFDAAPSEPVPAASMDHRAHIAALVSDMLEGHDRNVIATEVSYHVGKRISKYMLDAQRARTSAPSGWPA
jgi:hypothetical protein